LILTGILDLKYLMVDTDWNFRFEMVDTDWNFRFEVLNGRY
jgi:hypothetical protein